MDTKDRVRVLVRREWCWWEGGRWGQSVMRHRPQHLFVSQPDSDQLPEKRVSGLFLSYSVSSRNTRPVRKLTSFWNQMHRAHQSGSNRDERYSYVLCS